MSSPIYTDDTSNVITQQETILGELKLILATVKQIDANLIKSIKILEEEVEDVQVHTNTPQAGILTKSADKSSQDYKNLTYKDMVVRNIKILSDVLKALDAL